MRHPTRSSLLLAALVTTGCSEEVVAPEFSGGPQLDHTTVVASAVVDVNNYHLRMSPNEVFRGTYKGQNVFFAGQVAYGTDGQHVYFYDTSGRTDSFVDAGFAPVVVGGSIADHHTTAILVESDDQRGGERQHLELVTVRESFAFSAAPDDDYVIVRYTLLNPTDAAIAGAHLGFFADLDVGLRIGVNATYYDAALGAAVTYEPGVALRSAYVLLDQPVAHYQHWVIPQHGLGADLSDPSTYVGWFELLSGSSDAGTLGNYDVRSALTTDRVDIPARGSVALTVALVAGDDDADLAVNIAAARARFAAMTVPTPVLRQVPVGVTPAAATFTATISFPDAPTAQMFDALNAACGKAPISLLSTSGSVVTVSFDRLDVDPTLENGDRLHCTGRLSDGSIFTGFDTPELPDRRLPLTAVMVGGSADWAPTWAPDGHTIAFTSDREGVRAIYTLDLAVPGATPVRVTPGVGGGEHSPDFSPDGSEIVFTRDGGVFALDVATGVERQLTRTQAERGFASQDFMPRWSPDGTEIVVRRSSSSNNIFVIPASGDMNESAAVQISHFLGVYPDWGADGRIYYAGAQSAAEGNSWAIYAYDPVGGTTVRATPVESSQNRNPALSPDGGTLAFTSGAMLVLQDNALQRHLVPLLDPAVGMNQLGNQQNLEFSPDGARLIFTTATGDIWYVDLATVINPVARAEGLATSVQSLIDAGLLDRAGGAALVASLQDVAVKLENGQIGAALNKVHAYINQVNALIRSRRVGEIEGQLLVDGGNALAEQIGG